MKKLFVALTVLATTVSALAEKTTKLTPELLWKMKRISSASVNASQTHMVYGITEYKLEDNRGYRDLYISKVDGSDAKQLTNLKGNEFNVRWKPNSNVIGFLSSYSGSVQLHEVNMDGTGVKQITFIDGGISGFEYNPNGKELLYIKAVKLDNNVQDVYPDLPKANARIIDDLLYRHWDSWSDYTYTHMFLSPYSDSIVDGKDILEGKKWSVPTKPFDGMEQISYSPNGDRIAFSCKKLEGRKFAESTNTDIYIYNTQTAEEWNLTNGMLGYDKEPVFSPKGDQIAWVSMERPGFESDKNRIFTYNFKTKEKRYVTENLDQSAHQIEWSADQKKLYFNSGIHATSHIFSIDLKKLMVTQITEGDFNYGSYSLVKGGIVVSRMDITRPNDLYSVKFNGATKMLTDVNANIYKDLALGKVEKRWITTTDGKNMLVWVILPPNFDSRKEYPALLYCQGGPQAAVSQFFSFRWNFQLMAANDYVIVAPNRRGLPSFGQEWNDQISGDYGGQCMQDYLTAIDTIAEELYVDKNRLGAVGASFGGYSVYWLAGNHNKRFSAFISHCGLFNLESWYNTTEELFFANYDQGGPFWSSNRLQEKYNRFSPHRYLKNWDTPILVIHGEKDFRVPIGEGMQAFQAAQVMDIPSRFLYFPTEGHWVLSPQNGVLWHRVFFDWLGTHLKPDRSKMN